MTQYGYGEGKSFTNDDWDKLKPGDKIIYHDKIDQEFTVKATDGKVGWVTDPHGLYKTVNLREYWPSNPRPYTEEELKYRNARRGTIYGGDHYGEEVFITGIHREGDSFMVGYRGVDCSGMCSPSMIRIIE